MRKTTRDEVPKSSVFTRKKVAQGNCDENKFGSYNFKKNERESAVEALARMKAIESERSKDMVTIVLDDKTIISVRKDRAAEAEKLYKNRKP